jgi:DNA-binding winged helix-turn-helix (wHTH) protein/tetratricopeptide (TPR) repeat protein
MGMPGKASLIYEFGPFRLDPQERRLSRDGQPVSLRAKIFDTLCMLVEAHGHLLDKEELIHRLWPDAAVEEGNLATNVSALRKTLGEPATGQKFVETVPGRGYRFVAEVREIQRREATLWHESRTPVTTTSFSLIQRRNELKRLDQAFERALSGNRQVIFLSGEAGIGKTTVADAFAERARGKTALWYGCGQCLDQRGPSEAYMPVLEALSRMCRGTGGEDLIDFLARCAPTWLVQMPWLLDSNKLEGLQRAVLGATRDRMLREMVESVELLTAGKPMVLVLEDLHWSDYSTIDLITRLAHRRETARLLVIGTFRPTDTKLREHRLRTTVQELQARGLCQELRLHFLDESGVEEYLSSRFDGQRVPTGLARILHRRTEGSPLFLTKVVDHWLPLGLLEKPSELLSLDVPDTLRELVDRQLAMITAEEQAILEAASVIGREVSAAAVSGAIEQTDETVEAALDALARQGVFLNPCGTANWPDGTMSARYVFVHDLYRETLYGRILPGRRARLHLRAGARLETAYGVQSRELAAELAVHFVEANDVPRAVRYLRYAAEQALARSAHREAIELFEQALHLVESLPESAERNEYELSVLATLAPALMAIRGWGSPDAQRAYQRAKDIAVQLDDQSHHSVVLVGLATVFEARADYRQSQLLLEECLGRLAGGRPESLRVESHALLACSLFHQGAFDQSVEHAKHAVALYQPGGSHPLLAASGADPAIGAEDWAALSLWFLGYPDLALEKAETMLRRAQNHVFTLALAQDQAAVVHMLRRDPGSVEQLAGAAIDVASRNGFPYWVAVGNILHGWARAMHGETREGIAEIKRGLEACRVTGVEMDRPFYLALLAEACVRGGQPDEAMSVLDEAFASLRNPRTFFYEAELYRLRGSALRETGTASLQEVESRFQHSLKAARRYATLSLELRAAVSLARLWKEQAKHRQACELLTEVSAKFTEGLSTGDLKEAHAILQETGAESGGHPYRGLRLSR